MSLPKPDPNRGRRVTGAPPASAPSWPTAGAPATTSCSWPAQDRMGSCRAAARRPRLQVTVRQGPRTAAERDALGRRPAATGRTVSGICNCAASALRAVQGPAAAAERDQVELNVVARLTSRTPSLPMVARARRRAERPSIAAFQPLPSMATYSPQAFVQTSPRRCTRSCAHRVSLHGLCPDRWRPSGRRSPRRAS